MLYSTDSNHKREHIFLSRLFSFSLYSIFTLNSAAFSLHISISTPRIEMCAWGSSHFQMCKETSTPHSIIFHKHNLCGEQKQLYEAACSLSRLSVLSQNWLHPKKNNLSWQFSCLVFESFEMTGIRCNLFPFPYLSERVKWSWSAVILLTTTQSTHRPHDFI